MSQHALWFFDNRIRVFPIKPRDKEPACKSWDDFDAPREAVARFVNYGVALGILGVVDSDSHEAEEWVAANVPPTPFTVSTGRGKHRYYRLTISKNRPSLEDVPHFIHRAGLTIEFRHRGQYVVGPGSIHSSGAVYQPSDWSWNIYDLPFFPIDDLDWDDRPMEARGSADGQPFLMPPEIKAGERHDMLFRFMRSLQARGITNVDVLLAALHAENEMRCKPPVARGELERYIRRVSRHPDRRGFDRVPQEEWTMLAGMLETGMSYPTALRAVQSINPSFDPTIVDEAALEALEDVHASLMSSGATALPLAAATPRPPVEEPEEPVEDNHSDVDEIPDDGVIETVEEEDESTIELVEDDNFR